MRTSWLLLLCLGLSNYAYAQCEHPVRVGVNTDWPPYIVLSEEVPSGTDIAIVSLLMSAMHECVEFVQYPSSVRILTELHANRVDIVPGASFTEQRLKYGDYSVAYRTEEVRLLLKSEDQSDAQKSLKQLLDAGRSLVINAGAYYGPVAQKYIDDKAYEQQIVDVAAPLQRYKMLVINRIDMTLEDKYVARYLQRIFAHEGIIMHPTVLAQENIHFMVSHRRASPQFMARLNQAIANNRDAIAQILSAEEVVHP